MKSSLCLPRISSLIANMPIFRSSPFEELVAKATNEQNVTEDWSTIMEICDKVVNYEDGHKFFIQAIMKRLSNKVPRVVIQALVLLDASIKNCGKKLHLEISSRYFVTDIQKIFPKMPAPSSDKFKLLLKRWAENEFKEDPELGLIPSLYFKMKSEGVEFPSEPQEERPKTAPSLPSNPDAVSSQQEEEDIIKAIALSLKEESDSHDISVKEEATNIRRSESSLSSTSVAEAAKVRALYDFEAVEDNELTIKSGEVVIITDKSNSSWWKGSNHRGEGYIPSNFVTENTNLPLENLSTTSLPIEEEQTLPKLLDEEEEVTQIDKEKLEEALYSINEIDPAEDIRDSEELLRLERQCYTMAPLIEKKLQDIDKRCTMLNAVNEELISSIQLFYELSSDDPRSHLNPHSSTFESRPSSVPPTQFYTQASQHTLKQTSRTASSPIIQHRYNLPAQNHPTETVVPAVQYAFAAPPNVPSCYYQPVFTQLHPANNEAAYQVMLANVPEPQPSEQTPVNNTSTYQQKSVPTSDCNGTAVTTNDESSANSTSVLANARMPMMYQPVMLPPEFLSNIQNGMAYASYPNYFAVQSPSFMPQPSTSSFVTNYAAPVPVGNLVTTTVDSIARNQTALSDTIPLNVPTLQPVTVANSNNASSSGLSEKTPMPAVQ